MAFVRDDRHPMPPQSEDMNNQMTAYDATTRTTPGTALRATGVLALVGGAAWIIDTVTIAVLNRPFDPLDSIFFFIGFSCLVFAIVALAAHLSASRTGRARGALAVAVFLATAVAIGAISFAADTLGRRIFSPENIGLHDEWSCFTAGLCLLAIATWALRQGSRGNTSVQRGRLAPAHRHVA